MSYGRAVPHCCKEYEVMITTEISAFWGSTFSSCANLQSSIFTDLSRSLDSSLIGKEQVLHFAIFAMQWDTSAD